MPQEEAPAAPPPPIVDDAADDAAAEAAAEAAAIADARDAAPVAKHPEHDPPHAEHEPAHAEHEPPHAEHEPPHAEHEPPQPEPEHEPPHTEEAMEAAAIVAAAEAEQPLEHTPVAPELVQLAPVRKGNERYHASAEQLKQLIETFEENPCPPASTLNYLSENIGMPMHNLVLWFKNRRARSKSDKATPVASGTRRRSYVKSGIYSRSRNGSKKEPAAPPAQVAPVPVDVLLPEPVAAEEEAVPEHHQEEYAAGGAVAELPSAAKRPLEDGPVAIPVKRSRDGVNEVLGEQNPCRNWDPDQCHRVCVAFFDRNTGGRHPEQSQAAVQVSSDFFLTELQSGLTLTSAMQSLDTSLQVLENIMEKWSAEGRPLSSGSKVILCEFIAQVRSGQAASMDP